MLDGLETGASVAHNGCCLTVTEINGNHVSFDLMKGTHYQSWRFKSGGLGKR